MIPELAQGWSRRSDGLYAPAMYAGEAKDYPIIWSRELAGDRTTWRPGDDTIAAAVWNYPDGINGGPESRCADPDIPGSDNTGVITWLSGGTAGEKYLITLQITTAQGRVEILKFFIEVK